MPPAGHAQRAPALYVSDASSNGPGLVRLPIPPAGVDRSWNARAGERRARKAYFAALDALHLGRVSGDAVGRLQRLVAEQRVANADRALEHLLRVFAYVRRVGGRPSLAPPAEPLRDVRIAVPAELWVEDRACLASAMAWPIDWLRMRGYVVGKGGAIEWLPSPLPDARRARPWPRP